MTVFASAVDILFGDPNMAVDAIWSEDGDDTAVRLMLVEADREIGFSNARIHSESLTAEVRVNQVPEPRPGHVVELRGQRYVVQGEPMQDRDGLIHTVELVPE